LCAKLSLINPINPNKEKNENKKYLINVTIKFNEPTKEERPATCRLKTIKSIEE